jgi:hypothetical protein
VNNLPKWRVFCFIMQTSKFKQGQDWHIRKADASLVNLNTYSGADWVLDLLEELEQLRKEREKRGRRRKAGPSEDK